MAKGRIEEIDILKGLSIIVIALMHSFPTFTDAHIGTPFQYLYKATHASVIPLFFFLSGLFAVKCLDMTSAKDKLDGIKSRAVRLMIPYFVWGVLFIPLKLVFAKFAKNGLDLSELYTIFLGNNPCGQLWCLYALFLYFVFVTLFVTRKNLKIVLPFTLVPLILSGYVLVNFSGSAWFNICFLLFFFCFGMFMAEGLEQFLKTMKLWLALMSAVVYGIALYFVCNGFGSGLVYPVFRFILSFAGIYIALYVATVIYRFAGKTKFAAVLGEFGRYSMDIYVFHSPIGVVLRTVLIGFLDINRIAYSAIYIVVGVAGSYLISRFVVRKVPVFSLLLLGNPAKKKSA